MPAFVTNGFVRFRFPCHIYMYVYIVMAITIIVYSSLKKNQNFKNIKYNETNFQNHILTIAKWSTNIVKFWAVTYY